MYTSKYKTEDCETLQIDIEFNPFLIAFPTAAFKLTLKRKGTK